MKVESIVSEIRKKQSFLCIGLDVDLSKIPAHLLETSSPIFEFNKAIIDATHHFCVAYKPNIAFYEAYGQDGWKALKQTIDYLNDHHPEIFSIADAKRGDIGNSSRMYAKAFFEDLGFNSITAAPYMGSDSIEPFLEFSEKHTILLGLTSNKGAFDFQTKENTDIPLFESVLEASKTWKNSKQLMYVIGATKASYFKKVREIIPNSFLLVPGIGAQGGSLEEVCKYGLNAEVGLLVNSSRDIIYASKGEDFASQAAFKAKALQQQMQAILSCK